ncbi:hypothetical protein ACFSCX_10605 [Bacillus salitolerans]|uniref:Uncharacterized protein n=1 Tax=Bacillus salitolerans TaxID=1437434 RepID=A0ABW4LPM7_9BACI
MNFKEVITTINQLVERVDLVKARQNIELNINIVNANKRFLSQDARELLDFINNQRGTNSDTITRTEMVTISAINSFASKFDVKSIRNTIKNKEQLLMKKGIWTLLNKDAKVILKSIGSI